MAEGGTYSAGTIFLQVVPVFRDVQDKIRSQAKDINNVLGDDLEKGGKEAGDRAGKAIGQGIENEVSKSSKRASGELEKTLKKTVKDVNDALEPIQLKFENNDATRNIKELRKQFKELAAELDKGVNPRRLKEISHELLAAQAHASSLDDALSDVSKHDFARVNRSLGGLEKKLESVQRAADIEAHFDARDAERSIGAFERRLKLIGRRAAAALGEPINQEMAELKRRLEAFDDLRIGVDISDEDAKAELKRLQLMAIEMSKKTVNIQADADIGAAAVELIALDGIVKTINGKKVHVNVDVDEGAALGKLAALKAAMLGAGSGGENASNAFRSFNALILAAVTLLPGLIPLLGAAAGGLLAIGPLALGAGAGIGAMVIGFSGITTAVQAFSQQSKRSAADTEAAAASIRSALYSVRDAQAAVGDAERQAARSSVDSARAVAQARQSAAESIRSALEAQRQAQEAYRNSVQDVQDAEQSLRDARDAAKQAAQSTNNNVKDNRLAIRQAVLNAFTATDTLNAVMADGSSTNFDKASAKLAYDQAQQQLKELRQQRKDLAKEKKKQDKEGVNGSDQVQAAQDALTAALQKQKDAQRALGDAARNVDQARVKGAQAVQQALLAQSRSEADGARAVARAKENLRRAQESYNDALKKNNEIGSAADQNVRAALKNLGPAGREFARFIAHLQQGFYDFRAKVQAALLPPVQHAIERIIGKYGPQLQHFFVKMARAAGGFFTDVSHAFDSRAFQRFGRVFDRFAPKLFRLFGRITIQWLKIFASLMSDAAPYSERLSKGLLGMSRALSRFLESKKGREGVEHFMAYAFKVGPQVIDFLGHFIKAAVNLAVALAPWGGIVIKALDAFFKVIDSIPPKDLGLIATAILGLFIAFQAGVGIATLALSGAALIANPIALIVAAVVALVIIGTALYIRFKLVRTIVNALAKAWWAYAKLVIRLYVFIFKLELGIVKFIARLLHLKEVSKAVFEFLSHYYQILFEAIRVGVDATGKGLSWFWEHVAKPILHAFGDALGWLWTHVAKPVFRFIGAAFKVLGHIIKKVWDGFIFPVYDLFFKGFTKLWQKLLRPMFVWVGDHWKGLGHIFRVVWDHSIGWVLNKFGDGINWLWKKVAKPVFGFLEDRWHTFATNMKWAYDHTIKPVIDAFVAAMGGPDGLKSKFHTVVEGIKLIWAGLKDALTAPIRFVMGTVVNKGLIGGFNKIANFVGSKPMSEIHVKALGFAKGGVLPGYFPGGDNHHFTSPTGGRLNLSGGEAIMRPEFTKAVGSGFISALNQAARNQGAKGVKRLLNGAKGHYFSGGGIFGGENFANGGVLKNPDQRVVMDGQNIAAVAAAQILLAEKLSKRAYSIIQGSMSWGGSAVVASGTSHNYPGVADIARTTGGVSFADQDALRKVGFAAWARNIAGASYVGSGQHVHSASMLSPGTLNSPQIADYIAGRNGLDGGPDYGPRPGMLPDLASQLAGFDFSNLKLANKLLNGVGGHGFGIPGWLIKIAKDPIGYVGGLVNNPLTDAVKQFGASDFMQDIAGMPKNLVEGVARKVVGIIPGGAQIFGAAKNTYNALDHAGDAINHSVYSGIHAIGLKDGGVLPYNGTMKYDAGGYLPPGLTSVVNLTGKPEPVFTNDQFAGMGGKGGGLHYEPHFEGADLTPEDVMDDLEFTYRKMSRSSTGGRYAGARG